MPAASAETATNTVTAEVRRAAGKASRTTASAVGTSIAAPNACSVRNAISSGNDAASEQSAEASTNRATPALSRRRRPNTSAMRPAATRKAAKTML
jgi:hypothetical protein